MSNPTITEINTAIADGTMTVEAARLILAPRSLRDAPSGRRAAAWLAANGGPAVAPPTKVSKVKAAPKAKATVSKVKAPKGADSQKAEAWALAEASGAKVRSAEFWTTYKAIRAAQREASK